jgi:hypothetical protein
MRQSNAALLEPLTVMATPYTIYRRLPTLRQRSRRIAAIAAFTGFPLQLLGYSALVEPGYLPSLVWAPVSIALFSATVVGLVAIAGYAQGRFDQRDSFDERQRAMVDRAFIVSYGALTTLIVVIVGAMAVYLSFIGPITFEMSVFSPWFIAIGVYIPFLPLAALAWIEPDPPSDDEA